MRLFFSPHAPLFPHFGRVDPQRLGDRGAVRVVPPDDPAAFSQACLELLDDAGLRSSLAEAGSTFVRAELDPSLIAQRLREVLEG